MKKILYILSAVIVVSALSIALVQAEDSSNITTIVDQFKQEHWQVKIQINKGWNLVPEGGQSAMDFDPDTTLNNYLLPFYVYSPSNNKYITFNRGYKPEDLETLRQDSSYLTLASTWAYFTKASTVTLDIPKDSLNNGAKLRKGWNFVSLVPQFSQGQLTLGNCQFDKIYLWNPTIQNWEKTNNEIFKNASYAGYGVVVKTKAECTMSKEEYAFVNTVPALPDDATLELEAKKRNEERLSEMRRIQTSLELYYQDHSSYPSENSTITLGSGEHSCLGKNGFGPTGCENPYQYMNPVPSDPLSPKSNYTYISTDDQNNNNYKMNFYLETDGTALGSGKMEATASGIQRD